MSCRAYVQRQQACHGPPGSLFRIGELRVEDGEVTYRVKGTGRAIASGLLGEMANARESSSTGCCRQARLFRF